MAACRAGCEQINLVWLEAAGTRPDSVVGGIEFGMDAAYFAFRDRQAGVDLANIGDLELPEAPDSFEFFMPIVQRDGFSWAEVPVPAEERPIFVINTGRDGGLKAAWIKDGQGRLSGILIDISGRSNDGVFLDRLLGNGE